MATFTTGAWEVRRASLLLVKKLCWNKEKRAEFFISQSLAGVADWKIENQIVLAASHFSFIFFLSTHLCRSNWQPGGKREGSYNLTRVGPKLLQGQILPSRRNQMWNPVQLQIRIKRSGLSLLCCLMGERVRLSGDKYYLLQLLCSFKHNLKSKTNEKIGIMWPIREK